MEIMEAKPAVFLDKDGTLIPDIPYNVDPDLISLNEGVIAGLQKLQDRFVLIVVSNQSGVAKGLFEVTALEKVEQKLQSLLSKAQVAITGFYFCPHDRQGVINDYAKVCSCRKPQSGMLLQASIEHNLDLTRSWMIGDILNDVQAGRSVGCKSILINNGNETEWDLASSAFRKPDFIAANFLEAANYIDQN